MNQNNNDSNFYSQYYPTILGRTPHSPEEEDDQRTTPGKEIWS